MNSDPRPCYGHGGPSCWGPAGQNCPDCGRLWGNVEPIRVAYSRGEIVDKLTAWMLSEFGNPKDLSPTERAAWHQRDGLIMHFIRCHFPDHSGKYFQDYLDTDTQEDTTPHDC